MFLVIQTAWKGKHKIQDKWKDEEYQVVVEPTTGIPACKIQNLDGSKTRILHRNLLLPLQGKLRQNVVLEREDTLVTDIGDNGTVEVPSVPA